MRVSVLILVLSVGSLVGWSRVAAAEKVKTNQSTKVYSRPGEHGKVLLKLPEGQNMTVLAREGRWIKVRVRGMTGYVPRSKVDEPDSGELVRNTRRRPFVDGRGTKRGFGGQGGPDDRIGADATVDRSDDSGSGDDGGDQGSASKGDKDDSDDSGDDTKPTKAVARAKGHAKHDGDDDSADSDSDSDSSDSGDSDSSDSDSGDDGSGKARASSKHKGDDDGDSDSDGDDSVPDDDKTGDPDDDKRPKAHVVKKTVAYEERSADSDANFTAKPDMVLYPSDHKGKWTFVEDDEGDAGWVLSSQLKMDGGSDDGSSDDDDGGDGSSRPRQLDAGARLGVTILQQALHTAGSPPPMQGTLNIDNYSIGAPAVALALGGEALYPYSKRWVLGGAVTLDYAKTLLGGISFPTTTASTGVSFTVFNLRAEAGYDLHKKNGMMVFGRLGYRYQSFAVDDYSNFMKNPAKLPQETIGAPTLGAALAIPKLTDKIGLSFSLDAVLAGASVSQTKGLEDGASPSAKIFLVGGVFTYRWKKDMNLQGTYDLDYASLDFGKPVSTSMRAHMGTDVTRTDLNHIVTFGIVKGF